ncbi:unnamed protein product [Anisakis simplex]|uniref:Molybdenum cofactor sulfurase (inferred by orthology to a C. elegans protein) n=1 Tax=Anisakis simplex TaxID=6269 RepID=A0A0M3JRR4_ANISI|nr:unnamed protein product [Anisakis simplex]
MRNGSNSRRVYLDHAASTLPSESQLASVGRDLMDLTLILQQFNTNSDYYSVIFTLNATHSLKIVAECFDFGDVHSPGCHLTSKFDPNSGTPMFVYMNDAHTSVVGMRELIKIRCGQIYCVHFDEMVKIISQFNTTANKLDKNTDNNSTNQRSVNRNLFVITAMSNFCGRKYPLSVIEQIHSLKASQNFVCLDAASLVSTSFLDLSVYKPDFVTISLYKMFGYPTGVGALLVHNDSRGSLTKQYFGGGTVDLVDYHRFTVHRNSNFVQSFEDGTINFYGIASLKNGFDDLHSFGIKVIQQKTFALASRLYHILDQRTHPNGAKIADIYGINWRYDSSDEQGPIVTFNLLREDGSWIGYTEVAYSSLFVCCDSGTLHLFFRERANSLHDEEDELSMGLPTITNLRMQRFSWRSKSGNGRAQFFGADAKRWQNTECNLQVEKMCDLFGIEVRYGCLCNQGSCQRYLSISQKQLIHNHLKGKICDDAIDLIDGKPVGVVRVSFGRQSSDRVQCKVKLSGLEYDRQWMVTRNRNALSQSRNPSLCFIQPQIANNKLIVTSRSAGFDIELALENNDSTLMNDARMCATRMSTIDCGNEVAAWINEHLDTNGCRLNRISTYPSAHLEGSKGANLSNKSPYLLINRSSARHLANLIGADVDEVIKRFRANLVIDGIDSFIEDHIRSITIDTIRFNVLSFISCRLNIRYEPVVGHCSRCQMICIDQGDGTKDATLLTALRDFRAGSKITFGIYLELDERFDGAFLRTGMSVSYNISANNSNYNDDSYTHNDNINK